MWRRSCHRNFPEKSNLICFGWAYSRLMKTNNANFKHAANLSRVLLWKYFRSHCFTRIKLLARCKRTHSYCPCVPSHYNVRTCTDVWALCWPFLGPSLIVIHDLYSSIILYHGSVCLPSSKRTFPPVSNSNNSRWTVISETLLTCSQLSWWHWLILKIKKGRAL